MMRDIIPHLKDARSQSLFYWIIYSYVPSSGEPSVPSESLNPYFIGLSILIIWRHLSWIFFEWLSQSLFYWIIYSYNARTILSSSSKNSLNPYFIGLSILILQSGPATDEMDAVSILILLDYLFLSSKERKWYYE